MNYTFSRKFAESDSGSKKNRSSMKEFLLLAEKQVVRVDALLKITFQTFNVKRMAKAVPAYLDWSTV